MKCRLSVIIPTRNRAGTLPFTLRTCLMQEFDDCEILVSDNDSTPETRQVVDSFSDRRLKYVRTPNLLAMSDSWEFALSQASGEYVTFLGSDDGLLPHALPEMDRILKMLKAKVLRWESVCYNWPDLPKQDHGSANELLIPLKQSNYFHPIHRRSGEAMIPEAANCRISYSELPSAYCSAIHHSLCEELRRRTGRVFRSQSPDLYSSFAFAYQSGWAFHSLSAPMGINALSGQSNGVACLYLKGKSPIAAEFFTLNQVRHAWPATVPNLQVMSAYVADSFVRAKEVLFPHNDALSLDRKQLVRRCLQECRAGNDAEWALVLGEIRRSLADDAALRKWFEQEFGSMPFAAFVRTPTPPLKRYGGPYLHLDASEFGVTNVLEAALFCEKLLGYKRDGINCHLVPDTVAG